MRGAHKLLQKLKYPVFKGECELNVFLKPICLKELLLIKPRSNPTLLHQPAVARLLQESQIDVDGTNTKAALA